MEQYYTIAEQRAPGVPSESLNNKQGGRRSAGSPGHLKKPQDCSRLFNLTAAPKFIGNMQVDRGYLSDYLRGSVTACHSALVSSCIRIGIGVSQSVSHWQGNMDPRKVKMTGTLDGRAPLICRTRTFDGR